MDKFWIDEQKVVLSSLYSTIQFLHKITLAFHVKMGQSR